jgi:type I restriction enzyme, R subunit
MPSLASERATVQDPLVGYATEIGWACLSPEDALTLRRGASGLLLRNVLRNKLIELNPSVITVENVDPVIDRIEGVRTNIEGNADVLAWLRGDRTVYVEAEKRTRNVAVVDFEHPANNAFHVTDEWEYTNGQFTNRADVVFLLNGIPVALVETKAATKTDGMEISVKQIRRYHEETPELMALPQIFDVTHLVSFFYAPTWNLDRKALFNWKDEEPGNFEKKVKRFFGRERFLKLLLRWIIFFTRDDELRKIILRQHQMRAVERVVERALDSEKRRGLVWHTQGSGKTLTMIAAAEQILEDPAFKNPTVIMLVDRNELESQLFGNLTAYGMEARVAGSKEDLRDLLRSDYRGLIVSMIHKFDRADADLSTRENVFVLVDEAHRTTGGDLGNYLVGAIPNATLVGFTGTPIDRTAYGQGTFKTFGIDDPKGYLDKYSIRESIGDGTTLRLHYTLAPNEILVPREQLEREFLSLAEAEGVADIEDLNRILDRAVNLKAFLKAGKRVEAVADFVVKHFRENVQPLGYKAFLVGVDREACALYKEALDRRMPAELSRVVYTSAHNDEGLLKKHRISEEEEKTVRKAFLKPGEKPEMLIVTEKLLTGFDAEILYCMYLDKPMRDHTLLQAIARVNRPYEVEGRPAKPAGLVVDFVGIFEKLEKALAFDSDEVSGVIENIDVLRSRFAALMKEEAQPYIGLCRGPADDKAVERVIDFFVDPEGRKRFLDLYHEIETLYEILSPDTFLRPYLDDYGRLGQLFLIVQNAFKKHGAPIYDVARKTEKLVRGLADTTGVTFALPAVPLDEATLEALKKEPPDPNRVINLGRAISNGVFEAPDPQPHLFPIGERAEKILDAFEDRQVTTQDALAELEKLLAGLLEARRQQSESGLDRNAFAVFWMLKQEGVADPRTLAIEIDRLFGQFANYRENIEERRALKARLYKVLLPALDKERMVKLADRILSLGRK